MNKTLHIALALALGLALAASAYTPPTAEQLNAAAADPSAQFGALIQDASVNEAAAVAKEVAERIAALGLSADVQAARLSQIVQVLFAQFPPVHHDALAAALGDSLAGAAIPTSALVSIRSAIQSVGEGDVSGSFLPSFDQAFLIGGGTLPPAPNPEPPQPNDPPPPPPPPPPSSRQTPPPPPTGPDYPGQTIN